MPHERKDNPPLHLSLMSYTDDAGRALFKVTEDYHYEIGPGATIVIPMGYITNFGTIPRVFAWFISPAQLREAAILHDYLRNEDHSLSGLVGVSGFSPWFADAMLYESMSRLGFGIVKRTAVFFAVRASATVNALKKNT